MFAVSLGCTGSGGDGHDPAPDHYGVFSGAGGKLTELSGIAPSRVTQGNEGTGAVEFDAVANTVTGSGLYFVSYGYDAAVLAKAVEPGVSRRYRVGEPIALETQPISGKREMQRLTPKPALASGAYLLSVRGCLDNSWNKRCYFPFVVP
ncbi:MAG: hypothetical protein ABIZ80_22825 [Bryobacteraceae bacterium]